MEPSYDPETQFGLSGYGGHGGNPALPLHTQTHKSDSGFQTKRLLGEREKGGSGNDSPGSFCTMTVLFA